MKDGARSEIPARRDDERPTVVNILFSPDNMSIEVPRGTTILAAARKAGVFINSLCGGDGVCGKCRVNVRLGKVHGGTSDFLTREEIREGFVLACEAHAETDLVVEVPETSRILGEVVEADPSAERFSEDMHLARSEEKLTPLLKKYYLDLPKPSLENNMADLERLNHALSRATDGGEFQMGLKVIRTLPDLLRQSDWKVTALTAYRGSLTEITEVTPGNTARKNLAIVVDLGTTTVVAHLVDLVAGQTIGAAAKYNSQIPYGGDVVRRILHAAGEPDGTEQFQELAARDICTLISELQSRYRSGIADISAVVAAGNTTMMHFLLGLGADEIRREPYVGVAYSPPPFRAAELGIKISPRGLVYCLPSISSFVGADIVAGVLATNIHKRERLSMLIDIGTNGEVVIGNREWIMCASASAGPAFEGSESSCGMRATLGAMDHLRFADSETLLSYSTVGDAKPLGLCGSAYVDLLAELLRLGVIDRTGRLNREGGCSRIRTRDDGVDEYVIVPAKQTGHDKDIVLAQEDIINLVRAKAAIYAASQIIMKQVGLDFDEIEEIMVAGAFGNYLDIENAVLIGLLPDVPATRIRFVGNTSIAGAKLACLSREKFREAQEIAGSITYCELSTDPRFMDEFVSACFFPHTDIERFPSVAAKLGTNRI
ncbi:MAG: ASKHA domain-containing protein [Planctomycetota bacterium]|jgi:uncharacterized 2Fe-2S/4Fe-4S cluster protein (DUF4445 family)